MPRPFLILLASLCVIAACSRHPASQPADQAPVTSEQGIGYPSVQAAFTALKSKPGVKIREQQGWTMIEDPYSKTEYDLWSFAPQGYPAYPAAVERIIYRKNDQILIAMKVLCESTKAACDELTQNFEAMNNQIKAELRKRAGN